LVVNAQGDNPRNNHRKEKEKVYVSAGEWRMIMSAINHGTGILTDSQREVLMGYQYALHQHKKKLLQEKSELRRSHESNSASSRSQWEEYSETSESSEERYREPKHNRRRTTSSQPCPIQLSIAFFDLALIFIVTIFGFLILAMRETWTSTWSWLQCRFCKYLCVSSPPSICVTEN
jgi:hypothetical protein